MKTIEIKTEYIKLDSFLKLAGMFTTGGEAKTAIIHGDVTVNSEYCLSRGRKLVDGDIVIVYEQEYQVSTT